MCVCYVCALYRLIINVASNPKLGELRPRMPCRPAEGHTAKDGGKFVQIKGAEEVWSIIIKGRGGIDVRHRTVLRL